MCSMVGQPRTCIPFKLFTIGSESERASNHEFGSKLGARPASLRTDVTPVRTNWFHDLVLSMEG